MSQHKQRAPQLRAHWRSTMGVVPGILAALLPRIACPACWPAYAGLLGAVGLPILMDVRWLLPVTGLSLAVAMAALGIGARNRRGHAPFVIGLIAAALVLVGKFVLERDAATYVGTGLLICATVWNAWPKSSSVARTASATSCGQPGGCGGLRVGTDRSASG